MKIFRTIQRQYAILGISPLNQSAQKLAFNKRVIFGFLLFGCVIVSQSVYIFYVANDFMEYMEIVCAMVATVIVFICFAANVLRQTTLFESIDMIEKLIDTRCKYPKSEAFFFESNRQVEKLSEIVFTVLVKIALQGFIIPKCIICFLIYFITDAGRDSFDLPYLMWFPFDWNNPIGYLIAVITEYLILGYEFLINASTLGLGIGAFWFAISATKEIRYMLRSINDKTQANENQSIEIRILFSEFINAHCVLKQVEQKFSVIFQPIFMSLFTWSLLAISAVMLIVQTELQHGNVMSVLLNTTLNGILSLIIVFIACDLGQRMSNAFEEIELAMDELDWYLFPIEIQRMLPMIMENAQEPVSLECFGSIACSRETFRKVINRAYSYFTVLSQLGH